MMDVRIAARSALLVASLALGLLSVTFLVPVFFPSTPHSGYERLEIQQLGADWFSGRIYCRLRNTGERTATVMATEANGTPIKTGVLLPIVLQPGRSCTYAFEYDRPWQGFMTLSFHTAVGNAYVKTVDLTNASIDDLLQDLRFEDPDANRLITQARRNVEEASNAYSLGDREQALQLVATAVALIDVAEEAERSYLDRRPTAAGLGAIMTAAVLLLLLKRKYPARLTFGKYPVRFRATKRDP